MDMLFQALGDGKLCVVDVSQMRSGQALILSGLILRRIFDHNQREFTEAEPKTIPTIAVVEEAQAVLSEKASASEPYISWVKEGRKYDLGALLVTQQPGSIPTDILSQGDNWFIFHLLSGADLSNLRSANAHFSNDLLSALLNEPIPGQGVFWSSVGGTSYPVPIRVLSFEHMYPMRDHDYSKKAAETYAVVLLREFRAALRQAGVDPAPLQPRTGDSSSADDDESILESPIDVVSSLEGQAIQALAANDELMGRIQNSGVAWGSLKAFFLTKLPSNLEDRDSIAYHLVAKSLDRILGPQGQAWHSFRNEERKTYVRAGEAPRG
jgi:hypothetical protein